MGANKSREPYPEGIGGRLIIFIKPARDDFTAALWMPVSFSLDNDTEEPFAPCRLRMRERPGDGGGFIGFKPFPDGVP